MTVAELIEKLKACDPDAIVMVPFPAGDYPDCEDAYEVFEFDEHRGGPTDWSTFPPRHTSIPTGRKCVKIS